MNSFFNACDFESICKFERAANIKVTSKISLTEFFIIIWLSFLPLCCRSWRILCQIVITNRRFRRSCRFQSDSPKICHCFEKCTGRKFPYLGWYIKTYYRVYFKWLDWNSIQLYYILYFYHNFVLDWSSQKFIVY